MRPHLLLVGLAALAAPLAPAARAQLPVSGRPVPSLTAFDDAMQDYMDDHDITAGVLGVMAEGRVVYLRGFGHKYNGTTALPENALFRLASCSKPITAAAVRRLIASNAIGLNDDVFDVGQAGGGLLDVDPFPNLGDNRYDDVTVDHLLHHEGGWNRDTAGDHTYREREIAEDMGVGSPPGRVNTLRWILGQPLQFAPGTGTEYSNIGMLSLGLVVEQESGQSLVDYVRQNVLTPAMWVPATEVIPGRTFRADQNAREPRYVSGAVVESVFDSHPLPVPRAYGGWDHEARIGQGGYVASAAAVLEFLQRYHVGAFADDIGLPIDATNPLTTAENHNGAFSNGGLNSFMTQRTDGVNVFVVFNLDGDPHLATDFYDSELDTLIDGVTTWPTTTSDGFWVSTAGTGSSGTGGYNDVFASVAAALDYAQDGSKLRLNPGASAWTGVLSTRLLIDAPRGSAVLGE